MSTVTESAVSLRFSGDDLDPAQIARVLGGQPEIAYRKGEPMGGGRGIGRTGLCSFGVPRESPGDLDRQIGRLLDGLSSDLEIWRELALRYRGEFFIGLFLKDGNEGLGLEALTLERLAQRGLRVDLDIYYRGGS
ncbi:MAG: DUF4279 domain-containing protein [Devosia sp.]|jgi:hypothetical protein|nr:DUF4279 domain-containing protein [Devosia sp.]